MTVFDSFPTLLVAIPRLISQTFIASNHFVRDDGGEKASVVEKKADLASQVEPPPLTAIQGEQFFLSYCPGVSCGPWSW